MYSSMTLEAINIFSPTFISEKFLSNLFTTKDLSIFSFSFQLFIKAKIIKPTQLVVYFLGPPGLEPGTNGL